MAESESPRKRQRTKGPADNENASGNLNEPVKRATRACDQCRAQKKRCDSGHPCQTCQRASLECHYGKLARKRGFPTGYVRIIEALWALVFQAVPNSEETALHLLKQSKIGYDNEGKATLLNSHFSEVYSSRKAWLDSSIRREVDKLALQLEDGVAREIGAYSDMVTAPLLDWTVTTDVAVGQPSHSQQAIGTSAEHEKDDSHRNEVAPHDRRSEPLISIPANAWSLVETYFKFTHSWLPLTAKHSIVRALTEAQEAPQLHSRSKCLLWSIFALACLQQPGDTNEYLSKRFSCEAKRLIWTEARSFELSHAQALVVLTTLDMAKGRWEAASLTLRRFIQAMVYLQRSRPPPIEMMPELKRTVLAGFVLDTLLAARTGTIPQLRSTEVSIAIQFSENEADEWEQSSPSNVPALSHRPLRVLSTFKQYVMLLSILNDSLCGFHTNEDCEINLHQCRQRLSKWKLDLPKHCQGQPAATTEIAMEVLPPVANLTLTAEMVSCLLLGRREASDNPMMYSSFTDQVKSVSKEAYEMAFGSAAWRGILDLDVHRNRLGWSSEGSNDCLDVTSQEQSYHINLEEPNPDPIMEGSPTRSLICTHGLFKQPRPEARGLNKTNQFATQQVAELTHSEFDAVPTMNSTRTPGQSFPLLNFNQGSILSETLYDTSKEYSDEAIEALLEEFSEQQNVSWDEMEAQCMYNLGFMSPSGTMS
ncbi:uncharacterized protein Z520_09681 [Fonsecaea multimorphosa CBS 102226]|uniref:Zn(2)-C6 fungal-type domain-containing protein n=1 Tax=Fonsecaea multimorphosa CBS 102226 TaxID=1442371 RepID=A0A0D2GYK8_9EURO|nr:uncharacterized protein Z520_09681 [Fonsecaea multimorphosa CBS 102226]KIX94635.1 hypothetical protein Z520_09681 [Fonsecaea multimorphosa CBS 102226]OAL20341.1 hypothetical protein AYO22_09053 [Fonsecaea multimorphosa]